MAIRAVAKFGDLKRAIEFMSCMKRGGIRTDAFVYNVVIGGLCKEKKMKDTEKLFDEMVDRRVTPSLITYNTLIDGNSKVGLLEEAFSIRKRMRWKMWNRTLLLSIRCFMDFVKHRGWKRHTGC